MSTQKCSQCVDKTRAQGMVPGMKKVQKPSRQRFTKFIHQRVDDETLADLRKLAAAWRTTEAEALRRAIREAAKGG